MANEALTYAKQAKMLFWIWIGLCIFYVLTFALAPVALQSDVATTIIAILWIAVPIFLFGFWIWSMVVIVKGSKIAKVPSTLYIVLSIIVNVVGVPYSLWDLGRQLAGKKSKKAA